MWLTAQAANLSSGNGSGWVCRCRRALLRVTPTAGYGTRPAPLTWGSNHIRYEGAELAIRLTTDAPIRAVLEQNPVFLEDAITLPLVRTRARRRGAVRLRRMDDVA